MLTEAQTAQDETHDTPLIACHARSVWQKTIAISLLGLHLTTGREPVLGLLFYSKPFKARIAHWSSSKIPITLAAEPALYAAEEEDLAATYQAHVAQSYLRSEALPEDYKLKIPQQTAKTTLQEIEIAQAEKARDNEKINLVFSSRRALRQSQQNVSEPSADAQVDDEEKPPHLDLKI